MVLVMTPHPLLSHITQSSSAGTLSLHPTFGLVALSTLPALSLLCCQHPHIALGLHIHPPIWLCSRVFGIGILPSHRDSTRFGCIGKIASIPVLGRTPCEKSESDDEFCRKGSPPIWLGVHYSPFATCITRQAVITIIYSTLATRSATTLGRVGVTSQDLGGEEQESEEPELKVQEGLKGSMVLSSRMGIKMWMWKERMTVTMKKMGRGEGGWKERT
jgi:hypothetical protein